MPPKKSLRRKPPPDIDDIYSQQPTTPVLPPQNYGIPSIHHKNSGTSSVTVRSHRPNDLTVNTTGPFGIRHEDSYDELIVWESPKPMGPKELPELLDDSDGDTPTRHFLPEPYPPKPHPPYPVDDLRLSDSETEAADPFSRTSQIIADSLNTPSKIPQLNVTDSLQRPGSDYSETTPTRSEFSVGARNILTPKTSLQTLGTSYSNGYDRSPSPSKVYGRSPSLIYKYTGASNPDSAVNVTYWDENVPDVEDELTLHDRTSAWSSVETEAMGSSVLQDYYDDEYEDLYDVPDTPATNYFDYSILPDLPSPSLSPTSSPSFRMLPNRRNLTKKDSLLSISRKRMDDDLPPVPLDLPKLPFTSSSLVAQHLSQCSRIWSLSSIYEWCLNLETWLHDEFMSKKEFKKALIKLIVFHRRNTSLDVIGRNADQILSGLISSGAAALVVPEEKTSPTEKDIGIIMQRGKKVGGVLIDLTVCYCRDMDHWLESKNEKARGSTPKLRCYSSQCHLNNIIAQEVLMRNTKLENVVLGADWASHWKLTAEDLRSLDKSIAKRQSLIFDLLRYEQTFILRGLCFVEIVAPEFLKAARVLLGPNRSVVDKFQEEVINPGKEVVRIHQDVLFQPLLRILIAEGRFIKSVEEICAIYADWSNAVKKSLLQYMSAFPLIEDLLRHESIKRWVDVEVRKLPRVQDLKVNGPLLFISTFNSRYQQLPLQLSDIKQLFDAQDPEYVGLTKAIEGVKQLGSKINSMKIHADNVHALRSLQVELVWRKDVKPVNINLSSENRRLIRRGDLQRRGELKLNTYNNHLILLDNYLFVTERLSLKVGQKFRVTENPIPIELLLFEVKDRDATEKRGRRISPGHANVPGSSPTAELDEDSSTYSFKVRFAGRGKHSAFTFMAKSEADRLVWIESLTEAKTSLCKRLGVSAPYSLSPIDIASFSYDAANKVTKLQVCAPSDPLYHMSQESLLQALSERFGNTLTGLLQCYTNFVIDQQTFEITGLSSGLYCRSNDNVWKRIIYDDITCVSCIPELRIVLVLANKVFKYYTMDLILSVYFELSNKLPCAQLSQDSVQFFEVGKHRGMTMVFYAKKKSNSSGATNFKAVIPEIDNDGIFNGFKVIKRFYVNAECYGISIFNTSLAIHTSKGFEILELDKLHPRSVPELPNTDRKIDGYSRRSTSSALSVASNGTSNSVEAIRKHITSSGSLPMGMFKLNNNTEFLLVYNNGAVFTNKHGKISRPGMLHFDFRANSVAFSDNSLFLTTNEVIEVWSISDFVQGSNRLIQVITAKDARLIGKEMDCVFAVANPLVLGLQLMFALESREVAMI